MTRSDKLQELCRHQEAALGVLDRGVRCLDEGPAAVRAASATLRRTMGEVLGAYQAFKHERVFDPAIGSGDEQHAALARHMKVACIAAGEVFRAHMSRWHPDQITAQWPIYKPAARLTVNQLRRHIVMESESIAELIETYG